MCKYPENHQKISPRELNNRPKLYCSLSGRIGVLIIIYPLANFICRHSCLFNTSLTLNYDNEMQLL